MIPDTFAAISLTIGGGGFIYGLHHFRNACAERRMNAALEALITNKNARIAELEGDADKWKQKRVEQARRAALVLAEKRRAAVQERTAATRDALGALNLRPRDEVVSGVIEQRRSRSERTEKV